MIIIGIQNVSAQTTDLRGQLSGWTYIDESSLSESRFGIRYIPSLSLEKQINNELVIDSELSLNIYGSGTFDSPDNFFDDSKLKEYRAWLRFSSSQYEVRAGLQKINFGSAKVLRPLMWFDRVDPRDPLKLTDGVYGLLGRYYFLNNANIWLWGVYGKDDTKGWEIIPTNDRSVEYGGRFQYPLGTGEIAVTYHRRQADFEKGVNTGAVSNENIVSENRFALDGVWDIGAGLWFESVWIYQDSENLTYKYRNFLTSGLDYTFPVGSGLHVLGEHLLITGNDTPFGADESVNVSALSIDYNAGLVDLLTSIVYYDWDQHQFSLYAGWGRVYDNWSFYVNGFWNPDKNNSINFQNGSDNSADSGKGVQIMIIFNH